MGRATPTDSRAGSITPAGGAAGASRFEDETDDGRGGYRPAKPIGLLAAIGEACSI